MQSAGGRAGRGNPQTATAPLDLDLGRAQLLQLMEPLFDRDIQRSPGPAEFAPDQVRQHHHQQVAASVFRGADVNGAGLQVRSFAALGWPRGARRVGAPVAASISRDDSESSQHVYNAFGRLPRVVLVYGDVSRDPHARLVLRPVVRHRHHKLGDCRTHRKGF